MVCHISCSCPVIFNLSFETQKSRWILMSNRICLVLGLYSIFALGQSLEVQSLASQKWAFVIHKTQGRISSLRCQETRYFVGLA
jgi:hypothetical protein